VPLGVRDEVEVIELEFAREPDDVELDVLLGVGWALTDWDAVAVLDGVTVTDAVSDVDGVELRLRRHRTSACWTRGSRKALCCRRRYTRRLGPAKRQMTTT